jgi:hypothetical protein
MQTTGTTGTKKPRRHRHEWQNELQRLKNEYDARKCPEYFKDFGEVRGKWNDETANGLTKSIVDFLKYIGGNFTRVNVMGTPRKVNGRMIFTPSTTKKGTADIVGVYKGRYCAIEVKIGLDRQSKDQIQEQKDVEAAGGVYIIAKNFTDFAATFKTIF